MAKNKQSNGQKFGPKMARALKLRCDNLEDCVMSQQKVIEERTSEITNMKLSYDLMKRRYDDAMKYLELNRPEILQLMKASAKHGVLAAQGKVPSVTVKLVKRRLRAPKIPETELPLTAPAEEALIQEAKDFVKDHISVQVVGDVSHTVPAGPKGSSAETYNFKTKKFEEA